MTSPLVLAGQPKDQSALEVLAKVDPLARAARAEAPAKTERTQPPVDYPQNNAWSRNLPGGREFGLSAVAQDTL
jgi:hypothetical protein